MKTLTSLLTEKLKITDKLADVPTIADFICWYYGLDDISEFKFDDFEMTDFDPGSLDDHFDGSMEKQFEYILQHIEDPIGDIEIVDAYNDLEHVFYIGDIEFVVAASDEFPGKSK